MTLKIKPTNIIKNAKPLCFVNNWLVLYKSTNIIIIDAFTEETIISLKTPTSFLKRVLFNFKSIRRFLRLGAKNGVFVLGKVFMTIDKKIYSLSIVDFSLNEEYIYDKGSGSIYLTAVESLPGFTDGLYFGEYYSNTSKEPIKIIRRGFNGIYTTIYTFKKGEINHIHNIIPDKYNKCLWILAGDFDDAASIWQVKDNFKSIKRIIGGSQQYRSCVAFPTKEGLVYMTDTPFEQNYIRILKKENNVYQSKPLKKINGSVIYGCTLDDKIIFSTSTEPYSHPNSNTIFNWFTRKPGPGIIKNETHIVSGSLKNGFQIIDVKKKDFLPYRLFQIGTIMFPAGENPTNKLFSYSVANKKNDLHTEIRTF